MTPSEQGQLDELDHDPKYAVLCDVGYSVEPDASEPGKWLWAAPTDGSAVSYGSAKEASDAAWADASEQVLAIRGMDWQNLPFEEQKAIMLETLAEEPDMEAGHQYREMMSGM